MRSKKKSLGNWVNRLEKDGVYSFTLAHARDALPMNGQALAKSLQRLHNVGRVHRVRRGFYVVVPLEHAGRGIVPVEWFLNDLMAYLGQPFYLGCLSAAALHGAAHQRPQETQVVVSTRVRMIKTPVLRIRFFRFSDMQSAKIRSHRTHTGDVPVSSPEWTAIDLIRFQKHYGGMDAAATVLTELAERLDPERLAEAAEKEVCNAMIQRLGWMLDFLGFRRLTESMFKESQRRHPSFVVLNASVNNHQGHYDGRWKIIVNETPEGEL
jgi:predicted transcriptional regulator of viral defense system